MNEIVENFKISLIEDGKSPKTIESYVGDIKAFKEFLESKGVEFNGTLQRFYVVSYKNFLVESNYEVATINKKINSIHALNRYLVATGEMKEIVVENSKDRVKIAYGSEKQVEVYSDKEVDRILFYIQNESKVSKRNKVIVMLLLYTGVRVSELCSIKIKDIDFLNYSIKIYGKGGKFREVPLKFDLADVIKEYIKDRDYSLKDSEYLVIGQRGALRRDAINTMLERLTEEIGMINKLKPHTFRHTFCTRLINRGVPISTVSKLAGHSSVDTTATFYINSSREEKLKAVNLL
ncbi:tyrosine-type recombinase/integrase [Clostridium tertium]|uniref:tyrosine-type recombinase/integrase n=1 Tax=Clostridium TaxID=1485 RepID=UPI001DC10D7D|nr:MULTISPECIES: tyrosine-type recombinase/integrase [Clostridium]MBS5308811.1 tyrosine-type recombinase/integrase [Clostridium sp.]MDB1933126.1 tyrosine-type recombinase/integrase [Clostridium tertium]MDB1938185.1 tyrosine-type recombinase/integrase [Clostridium tertium]MDB1944116.1 tyrosine-type recombinase/integrase [Clostridium tertium]MDB1950718.1 tyrosine-type recombinase/integrase [Clostridium tertium]